MGVAGKSAQTLVVSLVHTALSMATGIVVARTLGVAGKGQAAVAMTAPTLLAFMGNLGIQTSIVYFIGQKDSKPKLFYLGATWLSLIIGAAIMALVWVLREPALRTILKGLDEQILLMSLIGVPLMTWGNALAAILIGRSHIWEFNKTNISQSLTTFVLVLVLVLALNLKVFGAVMAVILGLSARVLLSTKYVWQLVGIQRGFGFDRTKRLLRYGWQAYLGNAFGVLNNRIDIYLLNMLVGNYAVGIYSLGVNFAEMMNQVPEALRTVIHPKLVASKEYADRATPKACRQLVVLGVLLSITGALLCKPVIVLLYGAEFLPATLPFMLLLPGVIALGMTRVLFADLQSRGRPILTAYASATGLAPKVGLIFLLVPLLGTAGAAISASVSYWLIAAFCIVSFAKLSGVPAVETLRVGRQDIAVYTEAAQKTWARIRSRGKS